MVDASDAGDASGRNVNKECVFGRMAQRVGADKRRAAHSTKADGGC